MSSFILLAFLSTEWGPLAGFLILLALLLVILKGGSPRREVPVIENDPPQFPSDSPFHATNRRKAAAAAVALHHHTHPAPKKK